MRPSMGWGITCGGIRTTLAQIWSRIWGHCAGFSITLAICAIVMVCGVGTWSSVHSSKLQSRIMPSSKKIILLGREDKPTAILYHSLQGEFQVAGVIVEEGESRVDFVKRRISRLGWRKALGQVAFRVTVMPWLRWASRPRVREIIQEFGLDAAPLPAGKLTKVR